MNKALLDLFSGADIHRGQGSRSTSVKGLAVQDSFRNYDNQSVALNWFPNRAISRWPSWRY